MRSNLKCPLAIIFRNSDRHLILATPPGIYFQSKKTRFLSKLETEEKLKVRTDRGVKHRFNIAATFRQKWWK